MLLAVIQRLHSGAALITTMSDDCVREYASFALGELPSLICSEGW